MAAIQRDGTIRAYPCSKITFYYVMRFFNRFASEIEYVIRKINFGETGTLGITGSIVLRIVLWVASSNLFGGN